MTGRIGATDIGPALAGITRGDGALFRELVDRLLQAMAEDLAGLSRAVNAGDWQAAASHVHRIKGSGGLTRYPAMVAAAEDLEQALGRARPVAIRRRMPRFLEAAAALDAELRRLAIGTDAGDAASKSSIF